MPPQELRLILTLEHLPSHDIPGQWMFGLVLSASTTLPLESAKRDLLRPWLWNFLNGMPASQGLLYRVDIDGVPGTVNTVPAGFVTPRFNGCDLSSFDATRNKAIAAIQTELNEIPDADDSDLNWDPLPTHRRVNASVQSGISSADGKMRRPWPTILGQASRYAAPIPQILKISHNFTVRIPAGIPANALVSLLAAPIIQASGNFFLQQTKPVSGGPVEWTNHGGIQKWDYDQLAFAEIPVAAYLMPARIRQLNAPTTSLYDFGSLWLNSPREANDDEDWRATFEQRMADALDLGARVLEASRPRNIGGPDNRPNVAFVPSNENRLAIERLVLASLRDLAGLGYREGPGGKCLINMALATYTALNDRKPLVESFENTNKAVRQLIEQRVGIEFGGADGLSKWKKFLRETLEELAGARVLSDDAEKITDRAKIEDPVAFERSLNELEHVRLAVFRPANLERLVRAQWKLIAGDQGSLSRLVSLAQRAEFPVLDPRSSLARENLWSVWREVLPLIQPTPSDLSGRSSVVENFPRLFQSYFKKRFESAVVLPAPDCSDGNVNLPNVAQHPPLPGAIPAEVVAAVCQEIAFFSRKVAPQLVARRDPNAAVEPTDVPHAITIQVDSLGKLLSAQDEAEDPNKEDLLDQISGVGILMREKPASATNGKGWKCLNIASPQFRQADPVKLEPVENLLTLVPLKMVYQNDLRHGSVTYNNHPISSTSPLGDLSVVKLQAPKRDPLRSAAANENQRDRVHPIVSYVYPSPTAIGCASGTAARQFLPGLKFGSSYEVLPFLITNSGCLPRELAPDLPYEARLDDFDSERAAVKAVVQSKIRRFDYLRKVRIGELRVLSPVVNNRIEYPTVPEAVALRLRDLDLAPLLPEGTSASERRKEHPIVLLRPPTGPWSNAVRNSFSFELKRPATDINTWDRWVARAEANRQLRKDVWAAYYFESDRKAFIDSTVNSPDVSIDDPAVNEHLYLELAELDGASIVRTVRGWARYPDPVPDLQNALSQVRRGKIAVSCTVDETFGIDASAGLDNVTVHLTTGKLYRLTAWSCLAVNDRPRFDSIFPTTLPAIVKTPTLVNVLRVSPLTLFFEVATQQLLASDEQPNQATDVRQVLYDELSPSFTSEGEHPLRVQLAKPSTASQPPEVIKFRYLQRVELSRQVWRWQGRETSVHPRTTMTEPISQSAGDYAQVIRAWEASSPYRAAIEPWEEREFGNRSELDRLVVQMETGTERGTGRRHFEYLEKLSEQTGADGRSFAGSSDLRALHYRFSIQVFSRYAPLLTEGGFAVSANLDGAADPAKAPRTLWKPLFVPCRRVALNDPPKLKFILPLTESFNANSNGSAGALVVFDEPWYEIGGIGEEMLAEVVTVQDPAKTNRLVFEAGPDPLVATVPGELSIDPDLPASNDIVIVPPAEIRGPIGHTFDRSDDAPFFNATSFIVPAPTATRIDPGVAGVTPAYQVPWSFAKLRFQRTILKRTRSDNTPDVIKSPFTQPFWVQFIPEFSLLSNSKIKPSDLRVRQDNATQVTLVNSDEVGVLLPPSAAGGMFERYLVLTRRITDVRGERTHEAYIAVFARTGTAAWRLLDPAPGSTKVIPAGALKLRARVMEVQRRSAAKAISFEQDLWNSIFSESTVDTDRLRIVAVSNPIETV